jgi:hypothetical protein
MRTAGELLKTLLDSRCIAIIVATLKINPWCLVCSTPQKKAADSKAILTEVRNVTNQQKCRKKNLVTLTKLVILNRNYLGMHTYLHCIARICGTNVSTIKNILIHFISSF